MKYNLAHIPGHASALQLSSRLLYKAPLGIRFLLPSTYLQSQPTSYPLLSQPMIRITTPLNSNHHCKNSKYTQAFLEQNEPGDV